MDVTFLSLGLQSSPTFNIYPQSDNASTLKEIIQTMGGIIITKEVDDDFGLTIVDLAFMFHGEGCKTLAPVRLPVDVYSPFFIFDSRASGKLMDLNNYRLSPQSHKTVDANRLIRREISWSQISQIGRRYTQAEVDDLFDWILKEECLEDVGRDSVFQNLVNDPEFSTMSFRARSWQALKSKVNRVIVQLQFYETCDLSTTKAAKVKLALLALGR